MCCRRAYAACKFGTSDIHTTRRSAADRFALGVLPLGNYNPNDHSYTDDVYALKILSVHNLAIPFFLTDRVLTLSVQQVILYMLLWLFLQHHLLLASLFEALNLEDHFDRFPNPFLTLKHLP